MKNWKTLARKIVLQRGRFLTVEDHTVRLPDGHIIPDWPWVITPDFINAVVETEASDYLFFRQEKYAIEGESLAPVGGYLEPGEEPIAGAQRELLEETGYAADEWIPLGSYAVDGNRGAGHANFFLARGARLVAEPHADDLEEQALVRLSREEMEAALAAGEFKLLPWAAVVALALRRL